MKKPNGRPQNIILAGGLSGLLAGTIVDAARDFGFNEFLDSGLTLAWIAVAHEELIKLSVFVLLTVQAHERPLAARAILVGAGFAAFENVGYSFFFDTKFDETVALMRILPTLMHLSVAFVYATIELDWKSFLRVWSSCAILHLVFNMSTFLWSVPTVTLTILLIFGHLFFKARRQEAFDTKDEDNFTGPSS